jgi:hypothetical protein
VKTNPKTREDAWIEQNVSSLFAFIACLLIAPAIILQQELLLKLIQGGLLLLLLLINGKRLHLKGAAILIVVTVLFTILFPEGSVLFRIFGFPITLDALVNGCSKALGLLNLLYLSKLLIFLMPAARRPAGTVTLVTRFRDLLDKTLFYFSHLLEQRQKYPLKKIWRSLDEILLNTYKIGSRMEESRRDPHGTTLKGILFLVGLTAINWYFIVIQYINSGIYR